MTTPVVIFVAFVTGCAFGLVYFAAIWRSLASVRAGRATTSTLAAGALLRLAAALAFVAGVLYFTPSLIAIAAASIGFFASRTAVIGFVGRAAPASPRDGPTHGH